MRKFACLYNNILSVQLSSEYHNLIQMSNNQFGEGETLRRVDTDFLNIDDFWSTLQLPSINLFQDYQPFPLLNLISQQFQQSFHSQRQQDIANTSTQQIQNFVIPEVIRLPRVNNINPPLPSSQNTQIISENNTRKVTKRKRKIAYSKAVKKIRCQNKGEQCPICLQDIQLKQFIPVLKCKHLFHWKCLANVYKINPKCPCCRGSLIQQSQQ